MNTFEKIMDQNQSSVGNIIKEKDTDKKSLAGSAR